MKRIRFGDVAFNDNRLSPNAKDLIANNPTCMSYVDEDYVIPQSLVDELNQDAIEFAGGGKDE